IWDTRRRRLQYIPPAKQWRAFRKALLIDEDLAGRQRHECGVDVHRRWVVDRDFMNLVLAVELASQPLDAEGIGDMPPLHEDAAATADEIGCIEGGLVLRDHRLERSTRIGPGIQLATEVTVVQLIVEAGARSRRPPGTEAKVFLEQPPIGV